MQRNSHAEDVLAMVERLLGDVGQLLETYSRCFAPEGKVPGADELGKAWEASAAALTHVRDAGIAYDLATEDQEGATDGK